ncbi:MAG: DoxX family membrane protein [Chlorobiota bacterium]|nr:MAG: DoxX family membrane protein [Chlorobiota bacterium]
MRAVLAHPAFGLLARAIVGGIFVMYAVDKVAAPADFALNIERYQLVPLALVNLLAIVLPWLELVVGLCLLFGIRLRTNAVLAALMLVVFIGAIGSAMARGLEINCGCSARSETVGWGKIAEDAAYLLLTLRIAVKPDRVLTLEIQQGTAPGVVAR